MTQLAEASQAASSRKVSARKVRTPTSLAIAAVALYLVVLWIPGASRGSVHTGDTDNLVAGARAAVHCVQDGVWSNCGHADGARSSAVFPYPLLQYVPASALVLAGMSDEDTVEALARLNMIAFAGALVIAAMTFRRRDPTLGAVAVVTILASSANYQSSSGFGEMLAATALLAMVASVIGRRTWLIAATVAAAVISKETMLPFAIGLCWLVGREDRRLLPPRTVSVPAVAGAVVGGLMTVGFNIFRFGTPRNLTYLDPLFRTPGLARRLNFLAGGWLSPSAGVLWFWPIAAVVLLVSAGAGALRIARRCSVRSWLPNAALLGLLVAYFFGLATWLSPFGWITYGPRLAVPLLPAAVVAALHLDGDLIADNLRRLLQRWWRIVLLAVAVVAVGWPQFGAAFSHGDAVAQLIRGDATCPSMVETPVQLDADRYFECTQHVMWRTRPSVLAQAARGGDGWATISRALLAAACVSLIVSARATRPTCSGGASETMT